MAYEFADNGWNIMGKLANGETIKLFTWIRSDTQGIQRGWKDAKEFGIDVVDIWAEERD